MAAQEAETIASIYRDVWIDTYESPENDISRGDLINHFANFEQLVDDWRVKLVDENRTVWISKNNDGIITGFCVTIRGNNFNELEYIYIRPEYQKGGIGSEFMKHVLNWMGNFKPIVLYGAAYNKEAIKFYEKFGFELSSEQVKPKRLYNGKMLPTMKMVKAKISE